MGEYFELKPDEGFDFLLGEGDGLKLFYLFRENRGRQIGDQWQPLIITVVSKERRKALIVGDFLICFWGAFFFRESVWRVLGKDLEREGEVLRFSSDSGEPLFFLNPTVCNCLVSNGEFPAKEVPPGTPGKWIAWAEFDETRCSGRHVFMVPELWPRTFLSRSFVDLIKASGFTGARFDSVSRTAT